LSALRSARSAALSSASCTSSRSAIGGPFGRAGMSRSRALAPHPVALRARRREHILDGAPGYICVCAQDPPMPEPLQDPGRVETARAHIIQCRLPTRKPRFRRNLHAHVDAAREALPSRAVSLEGIPHRARTYSALRTIS
jgi:hypothetical protein